MGYVYCLTDSEKTHPLLIFTSLISITASPLDNPLNGELSIEFSDVVQISNIIVANANAEVMDVSMVMTPIKIGLHSNYPNPFNPVTTVSFELLNDAIVEVSIYTLLGEKVTTLSNGKMTAGSYAMNWSGFNYANKPVSSGKYLYRITADGEMQSKMITLLK